VLAGAGKLEEAEGHFRVAVEAKPDSAEFQNNLGRALAGQGKSSEAIARYQAALELNPATLRPTTIWGLYWPVRASSMKLSPSTGSPSRRT
jgi:Flp pilus assembly protein TadD